MPSPPRSTSLGDAMREASPYLGLGFQVAAAMGMFAGGGIALDHFAGTSPWGVIIGCVMGIAAVFAVLYKLLIQLDQKDKHRRAAGPAVPGANPPSGPFH